MDQKLSRHARTRLQQRGIPPVIIDLLQTYGKAERAGKDAMTYYFDKASRRKVMAYFGGLGRSLAEYLNYYAVIGSNGQVITAALRTGKVNHN